MNNDKDTKVSEADVIRKTITDTILDKEDEFLPIVQNYIVNSLMKILDGDTKSVIKDYIQKAYDKGTKAQLEELKTQFFTVIKENEMLIRENNNYKNKIHRLEQEMGYIREDLDSFYKGGFARFPEWVDENSRGRIYYDPSKDPFPDDSY